jgi:hypothetical protein
VKNLQGIDANSSENQEEGYALEPVQLTPRSRSRSKDKEVAEVKVALEEDENKRFLFVGGSKR